MLGILKKIAYALLVIVIYLAILLVIALSFLLFFTGADRTGTRTFFGFAAYEVLTGSMYPAFDANAVIIVRSEPADQLKIGDIISYRPQASANTILTHRIYKEGKESDGRAYFVTKGDANLTDDRVHVYAGNIIGKVVLSINGLGTVFMFARTPMGITTIAVIIVIWFVAAALMSNADKAKKRELEEKEREKRLEDKEKEPVKDKEITIDDENNEIDIDIDEEMDYNIDDDDEQK